MSKTKETTVEAAQQPETKPETTKAEKTEKTDTAKKEKKDGVSVLEKVGQAAIKEHGFKQVFVTSDGQVFSLENNAKNHAANLKNRSILTVKK